MAKRIKNLVLAGILVFSQIALNVALFPSATQAVTYPNLIKLSGGVGGAQANDQAYSVTPISANGQYVTYVSRASNMVPNDTNGWDDIFVTNVANGATERVSVTSSGQQLTDNSYGAYPSINADGSLISFSSGARLLTGLSFVPYNQIFIRNRTAGTTTLASTASDGTPGNGNSAGAKLSADGKWLAFYSTATNLVPGDTNNAEDIFLKNLQTNAIQRITVSSGGIQANGSSFRTWYGAMDISADGRYILFASDASNLVPSDTNGVTDMFLWDRIAGTIERFVPSGCSVGQSYVNGTISDDGRWIALAARGCVVGTSPKVVLIDRQTAGVTVVGDYAYTQDLSADGRYLTLGNTHLSRYDRTTNTRTVFALNSEYGSLSASGNSVAFVANDGFSQSPAAPYPGDTNGVIDLFVRQFAAEDSLPPVVAGVADRQPDYGDWYNGDVTIDWQATDPAPSSGMPTDPANTVANIEGQHTYTSGQSCDPAGNCATGSLTLKIDKSGPVLGAETWSANPVGLGSDTTLTVPVSDAGSGVANGEYFVGSDPGVGSATAISLSGGNLTATFGSNLPVGSHQVGVRAKDNTGHWSALKTVTLTVRETTPPVVTYLLSAQANAQGWFNSDVTIDWQSTDASPSSGTPTDPADTLANIEGEHTYTSGQSCDPAGNCATGSATLKLDKTKPTISNPVWSVSPLVEGHDATLTTTVADATSGPMDGEYFVGTDPGQGHGTAMTLSNGSLSATFGNDLHPGTYSVGLRVRDQAGNWSDATTTSLQVIYDDHTPPVISHLLSTTANGGGWFNSPVTLTWTVTDGESPITDQQGCDSTTINQDGEHTFTCTATSTGGTATSDVTVKYDATVPQLGSETWTANPSVIGQDTTLTVPVSDNLSGAESGEYFVGTDPGVGNGTAMGLQNGELSATFGSTLPLGTHTVGVRAKDAAGNWSELKTLTLTVIDVTPPTITYSLSQMPGLGGWYNAPVVLVWNVSDAESAIVSQTGCDSTTINADTPGATYTCTATSSGGTASQSTTIAYDATAPTVATPLWSTNPLPQGTNTSVTVPVIETLSGVTTGEYFIDTDPGVGNGTVMTWDGVANNLTASLGASVQPGVHTVGFRAKDLAGNWSQTSYDYLVVYDAAGPNDVLGKKDFAPSLANGDVLPGLTSPTQTNTADFGFNVYYGAGGTIDPLSQFTFCYDLSGKKCHKPQNNPFQITSTNFSLLSIYGTNNSQALIKGTATMTLNGTTSTVAFQADVLDADLTPSTTDTDHLTVKIYPVGGSPANPTYQVSANITGPGNSNSLKIQTL